MRRVGAAAAAAAAVLVLALTWSSQTDDLADAQQRWEREQPDAYSYTFRSAASVVSQARVTVRGDAVSLRVRQEDGIPMTAAAVRMEAVFGYVAEALREGGDVDVEYDEDLGYPRLLRVDPLRNAIDDEYGIRISDFVRE